MSYYILLGTHYSYPITIHIQASYYFIDKILCMTYESPPYIYFMVYQIFVQY